MEAETKGTTPSADVERGETNVLALIMDDSNDDIGILRHLYTYSLRELIDHSALYRHGVIEPMDADAFVV